ncbi:ubiquinol oxidase subunit II [Parasphingorhabdus halotolerans]|uniref:Ubiquinol oxidase subunit 2 n=2 Tax=Parasphingorhabdus halotolerans TaxID=2725558 RepID=A0A6H2DQD8_9SPHN|nr:ubiquinol oxidase subunit II [Parasphingorhabdus halotolerans]
MKDLFDSPVPFRAAKRVVPAACLMGILGGCQAVVLSPSGDVAAQQRDLIVIATVLMLLIIIPVMALTVLFARRYAKQNANPDYQPDWDHSTALELVIWAAPLLIIICLGAVTWVETHKLDPYRPIERLDANRPVAANVKPLEVQVVSLDWKWLFIYPEYQIATVNELAAPVDRPIAFRLTSSTVMNAFYIPALAGMIYTMPGMETKLHAVINKPGDFAGFSSNFSGSGFSKMRFRFHGLSNAEFDRWVAKGKAGGQSLDRASYLALAKPSEAAPVMRFSSVSPGLYTAIVNQCVAPGQRCMADMMRADPAPAQSPTRRLRGAQYAAEDKYPANRK